MKNKRTSLWLCLFLGWLGVHRFYEGKIPTGILYMCTLGLFGFGWLIDLWLLSIKPNKPITESPQYGTYLEVVEALQKNGYILREYERNWGVVKAEIYRGNCSLADFCGFIFVVADPTPGFVSHIIGVFSSGYAKFRYDATDYAEEERHLKYMKNNSFKGNFDSSLYWPDGCLIGGFAGWSNRPTEDCKWLGILKSVIG